MLSSLRVTRRTLQRDLVVNAATSPAAIVVGAAVGVAALLMGAAWLLLVSIAAYVALAVATLFDPDEAARVGARAYARAGAAAASSDRPLAPEIEELVARAREERRRIAGAIADADVPLEEVVVEVDTLTSDMENIAARAQRVRAYLDGEQPEDLRLLLRALRDTTTTSPEAVRASERAAAALTERLRVIEALEGELARFRAEMEHLIATLGIVHGHVVRMSVVSGSSLQEDVAAELRELRVRVAEVADGMSRAVLELGRSDMGDARAAAV